MARRLIIGILGFAAACAASCRTLKNIDLEKKDASRETPPFLPWTADQQALMKTGCSEQVGKDFDQDVAASCECLIEEASKRWPFDKYVASEREYLDKLIAEGAQRCNADSLAATKKWQAPMSLRANSDERFHSVTPSFAMNPRGDRIAVVWAQQEQSGAKASIHAKIYRAESGWSPLTFIDANDSPTAVSASPVVTFLNDSALAVWHKDDGTLRSIWTARFNAGVWEGATRLEADVTQSRERLAFAAHSNSGQAAIAWSQQIGTNQQIFVRRFAYGQWQEREVIDAGTARAFMPTLHFTAEGELIAVWSEARGTADYAIASNRYGAGKWTGPTTLVSTGSETPYASSLASGTNKVVTLAWLQDARGTDPTTQASTLTTKVLALLRTSTGVWQSTPAVLEKEKGGDGFQGANDLSLQVGFDGKGTAHVVWQKQEGTLSKIWTARADDTRWSTKELLHPNIPGLLKNPIIAYGGDDLVIGFDQQDNARREILASSWKGSEWQKVVALEDLPDPVFVNAAIWHPAGIAALLWSAQPEGGDGNELFLSLYRKTDP